ncbi:MAG: response regulator [Acidobacteria bacterium]|jgi:two-component system chemotaxis sensor kinase CheA|nr:response regulator [Acidobacteriota bacterium]
MTEQNKKKDFLEKLKATFCVEADEHIKALTSGLLRLEKTIDINQQKKIIEILFREAHNLKGAARSVDFTAIERICQALEKVLQKFKMNSFIPQPGIFDILHHAVDIIAKLNGAETQVNPDTIQNIIRELSTLENKPMDIPRIGQAEKKNAESEANDKEKIREDRRQLLAEIEARRKQKKLDSQISEEAGKIPNYIPITDTIRVSATKLDNALLQSEELIYGKFVYNNLAFQLSQILEELNAWEKSPNLPGESIKKLQARISSLYRSLENDRHLMASLIDNHLRNMKEILMLPFSTLTEGFPKVVRDLAREQGKEIDLIIEGAEMEIEKRILSEIKIPLLHLLRNAIDHGIETPQARSEKNKPVTGIIHLSISHEENRKVKICLSDDGAGIDLEKIKEKSIADGLITGENLKKWTDSEILNMIFRSGFSMKSFSSKISGRGLGIPIAKEKVEKLGGSISVTTELGKGTSFTLILPVALGAFRGVIVGLNGAKFIIPVLEIKYTYLVESEDIKTAENRDNILIEGRNVSLVSLAGVLNLPSKQLIEQKGQRIPILLLCDNGTEIAFRVDEILGEEEVLLKNLGPLLKRVINVCGVAVLGSNEIVPILNPHDLIRSAIKKTSGQAPIKEKIKIPKLHTVLLIEDSITTRILLKNIMETAGYHVITAVDGETGWALLKTGTFDIVVSDVDMPGMDGFELTAKIRADKNLAGIPVILVTGLETEADREKGIEVGANAYLVKSNFDQGNLLDVMKKII